VLLLLIFIELPEKGSECLSAEKEPNEGWYMNREIDGQGSDQKGLIIWSKTISPYHKCSGRF
jgi:hypothetical protein